jgi:hypothetical protein
MNFSDADIKNMLTQVDENLVKLYESLDPVEKEWAKRALGETAASGKSLSLDFLTSLDYERSPVSIEQFLNDEYYLGFLDIWPKWQKEVRQICNPANRINEVVLGGGIGLGKTWNSMVIMTYKLYELSCLRYPASYHGLAKGSPIVFGIYNATLKLTDVGIDTFAGLIDNSPYFQDNFKYREESGDYVFPKNIKVVVGSRAIHVLGQNLYCLAIDEMNFHAETKKQARAKVMKEKGAIHELVTQTSRRMESRFKLHGRASGLIIHISSTKTASSYLELRKKEVRGKPGVYIVEGPQWEFHPSDRYCGKKFRFSLGNKFTPPEPLDKVIDHGYGNFDVVSIKDTPRTLRVIEVPVEDYRSFLDDPIGSIRDIAGLPTESVDPFFPRGGVVASAADPSMQSPFRDGFGVQWDRPIIIDLETSDYIHDFLDRDLLLTIRSSREVPRNSPNSPRYIHCDLARTEDSLGLAMVHPTSAVMRQIRGESGEIENKIELSLAVDFAIQIKPSTSEVDWQKIREFIMWLHEHRFQIANISYDSPVSAGELQYFKKLNMPCQYLSVDRRPSFGGKTSPHLPYYILKTLLNEGRVRWAPNEVLQDELLALEKNEDTDTIDHPPGGSKDVADSVCGAVFTCMSDPDVGSLLTPVEGESLTHQDKVLTKVKSMLMRDKLTSGQAEYPSG